MFSSSRRRRQDERGSVAIQMVFLMPALFLLMFLGLQGALYYHAKQVALAAAQEGAREAGSENGTHESGVATANGFLAVGPGCGAPTAPSRAPSRGRSPASRRPRHMS